jgi:hypothetical protein
LLASPAIADSMKGRLRAALGTLDPLRLLDEIRTVQHHLAALAIGEHVHVLPHRDVDLDRFLNSLTRAWRDGEVRPAHRSGPKPPRHWRTRTDPFEATWPRVVNWLESEPDRTAKELLERLQAERPGDFSVGQVRTLHDAFGNGAGSPLGDSCLCGRSPTWGAWRRGDPTMNLTSTAINGRPRTRRCETGKLEDSAIFDGDDHRPSAGGVRSRGSRGQPRRPTLGRFAPSRGAMSRPPARKPCGNDHMSAATSTNSMRQSDNILMRGNTTGNSS